MASTLAEWSSTALLSSLVEQGGEVSDTKSVYPLARLSSLGD